MNLKNINKAMVVFCMLLLNIHCFGMGKKIASGFHDVMDKSLNTAGKKMVEIGTMIQDKLSTHEHNKKPSEDATPNVPEIPVTENTPLQAPVINTTKSNINDLYSDADDWPSIIEKVNTEKFCSDVMLKICCAICNQTYYGITNHNSSLLESSKNLTESAVKSVLKNKSRQYEFKAALLCFSLAVYNEVAGVDIWNNYDVKKRLHKYASDYQYKIMMRFRELACKHEANQVADQCIRYTSALYCVSTNKSDT